MSETETIPSDTDLAMPAELPGQYLSRARETRGLSVADIARTLKFSERQIDALERDDYQVLSGSTFIRGFIRSYARVLKIDPVPLVAMLDAGSPHAAAEVVAPGNMGDAVPQAFMKRHAKWSSIVVAVMIILSAGYVWLTGLMSEDIPVSQTPQPIPVAKVVGSSTEIVAPAAPIASAMNDQLVVDFDDKSWIEIKDATESVVLTGEFPGGFHQAVSGHAPFQVWIGNAAAVRMKQGDRLIDLLPHTREGVARLTVD